MNWIWNLQSGGNFIPTSPSGFGSGGDFNADGQRGERPDRPDASVPRSFSHHEWLARTLKANVFPFPNTVRAGNMPRDYFRGPGYARLDLALVKTFPIPIRDGSGAQLQLRVEALNVLNHVNIRGVASSLTSVNFGRATSAYQARTMQLAVKMLF